MTDAVAVSIITSFSGIIIAAVTGIFVKLSQVSKNVDGNLIAFREELKIARKELLTLTAKSSLAEGVKREKDRAKRGDL